MRFNVWGMVRSASAARVLQGVLVLAGMGWGLSACRDGEVGTLIAVAQAGTVEGSVRDALGAGLSGVALTLSDGFGDVRAAVTDGTGAYRFAGVGPGSWVLDLAAPAGFAAAPGQALQRQIEVSASGVVREDFRLDRR